jgi:hypothetical protein
MHRRRLLIEILIAAVSPCVTHSAFAEGQTTWQFNNLSSIGGLSPTIEGTPTLVDSPIGKAIQFDGKTSIFLPGRPLVGAKKFSIEIIFRPEGGDFQQRWMHIAETDPATGLDANPPHTKPDPNPRFMFELRTAEDQWYLDAYVTSKGGNKTLAFPDKLYPIDRWYAVEQTYDGKTYRSYVNGELQGEGDVGYSPQGPGHTMFGSRLNHVDYFKGSIALARFTDRALNPDEFIKVREP